MHTGALLLLATLSLIVSHSVNGPSYVPNDFFTDTYLSGLLLNSVFFYAVYYLVKCLKHRWLLLSTALVLFSIVVVAFSTQLDLYQLNTMNIVSTAPHNQYFMLVNSIVKIFFLLSALLTKATLSLFIQRQAYSQLKLATLTAELSLLKSQTNPHFLFNTLNALYTSAYKFGDSETANGIAQMSSLMRYMLHKSEQEQLSLGEEIEQIEAYIAVQNFRFKDKLNVIFDYTHVDQSINIASMLLMPLVENAFKYGVNTATNSTITIALKYEGRRLFFKVVNHDHSSAIKASTHFQPSGTGIKNLQQRLVLLYQERHLLHCFTQGDEYHATLELTCL